MSLTADVLAFIHESTEGTCQYRVDLICFMDYILDGRGFKSVKLIGYRLSKARAIAELHVRVPKG